MSADPAYAEPQKSIFRNSHSDPRHGALQTSGKAVWEGVFALFPSVENFHLTQMSAKGLRVPPSAPPSSQRINQALGSHSLERESSLLAVCYDLHVVCKSYPQNQFVNSLTYKDAETAVPSGRMETISGINRNMKGHTELNGKCQ